MSRVFIRYALPRDADRLVADGVVGGPTPSGEPWLQRVQKWLAEQQAGRRLVLVAEDASGLLGTVQLVFRFPPGYADPEAANGIDVAMVEALRTRTDAPHGVATQLITDVQNIARKRGVKTLTFLLRWATTAGSRKRSRGVSKSSASCPSRAACWRSSGSRSSRAVQPPISLKARIMLAVCPRSK